MRAGSRVEAEVLMRTPSTSRDRWSMELTPDARMQRLERTPLEPATGVALQPVPQQAYERTGADSRLHCASRELWGRLLERAFERGARGWAGGEDGEVVGVAHVVGIHGKFDVVTARAVASLTKSLAVEWAPHGVTVNAVAPGVFRTDLNAGLLDGTGRGQEFLMRTPMKRSVRPTMRWIITAWALS